jgi:hypothetical protein
MKLKSFGIWSALALLIATNACTKASPTRPSEATASSQTTSVTDATTGVTLTSPSLVTPTANQQFKNVEQPVTLTIKNAVTSGTTALTYTFEVASDAAFGTKVFSKDGVAAGSGTTALKIDKLPANKTYFWRARAQSGSLAGPYSEVRSFGIGPEVILAQPVNGDPQPNATVGEQPTLNVNNVGRSGPNGPIFYRFEISDTAAFGSVIYSATVAERTDRPFTGHDVTTKLVERTYFWRVTATDPANAVTSTPSTVSAMRVQPFSLQQATILDSPDNFAFFTETARITTLIMGPSGINVDFTKKNGPDRWPDIFPPGFAGPIQYCLGLAFNIDGHWYASAPIEMWNDRAEGGGPPQDYALNWFYNPTRWAPMTFHQPQPGETIGFFVVAGDVRGFNSNQKFQERSNVVLVPMPDSNGATYTFGSSGVTASSRR